MRLLDEYRLPAGHHKSVLAGHRRWLAGVREPWGSGPTYEVTEGAEPDRLYRMVTIGLPGLQA